MLTGGSKRGNQSVRVLFAGITVEKNMRVIKTIIAGLHCMISSPLHDLIAWLMWIFKDWSAKPQAWIDFMAVVRVSPVRPTTNCWRLKAFPPARCVLWSLSASPLLQNRCNTSEQTLGLFKKKKETESSYFFFIYLLEKVIQYLLHYFCRFYLAACLAQSRWKPADRGRHTKCTVCLCFCYL